MALRKRLIERNVQTEEATALACALLNDQALAELASELHRLVELLSAGSPLRGVASGEGLLGDRLALSVPNWLALACLGMGHQSLGLRLVASLELAARPCVPRLAC
jgi:hypothetical protein